MTSTAFTTVLPRASEIWRSAGGALAVGELGPEKRMQLSARLQHSQMRSAQSVCYVNRDWTLGALSCTFKLSWLSHTRGILKPSNHTSKQMFYRGLGGFPFLTHTFTR